MKKDFIPNDYKKIDESSNMIVYEVKTDDRFMGFICKIYNTKLCLCIDKSRGNGYMCMFHIDDCVSVNISTFGRRVVFLKGKNDKFTTPYAVACLITCDSFRMNVSECIKSFKLKFIDAVRRGFNILIKYSVDYDLGIIPYGSSENEIMMKLELMGFK